MNIMIVKAMAMSLDIKMHKKWKLVKQLKNFYHAMDTKIRIVRRKRNIIGCYTGSGNEELRM